MVSTPGEGGAKRVGADEGVPAGPKLGRGLRRFGSNLKVGERGFGLSPPPYSTAETSGERSKGLFGPEMDEGAPPWVIGGL